MHTHTLKRMCTKLAIEYLFFGCSELHFQLIHVNFCAAFCSEYDSHFRFRYVWIAVTIYDTWQTVNNRTGNGLAAV